MGDSRGISAAGDELEVAARGAALEPAGAAHHAIRRTRRARAKIGALAALWPALVALAGVLQAVLGVPGLSTTVFLLGAPLLLGASFASFYLNSSKREAPTLTPAGWVAAQEVEAPGLLWPVTGAALMAPLTVHGLVWLFFGVLIGSSAWAEFDLWLALSLPLTALAHGALVVYARRFARGLLTDPLAKPAVLGPSAARAVGMVTLAGTVPGVVLLGVPTALVAVTGLLVIPLIFNWAADTADRERTALLEAVRRYCQLDPEGFEDQVRRLLLAPSTADLARARLLQLLFMVGTRDATRRNVQDVLHGALAWSDVPYAAKAVTQALDFCDRLGFALDPEVAEALSHHPNPSVSVTLAKSLRRRPQPFAQDILRKMLGRREPEILRAAVHGLSRIGSHVDIAHLGGLVQHTYFPAIRDEARAAIRCIRARSGGAGPAALSFPAEVKSGGALSLSAGPSDSNAP